MTIKVENLGKLIRVRVYNAGQLMLVYNTKSITTARALIDYFQNISA